jgi:hypothetical protein
VGAGILGWGSQPVRPPEQVVVGKAPEQNRVTLRQILRRGFFAQQIQHVPLMVLKTLDGMDNPPRQLRTKSRKSHPFLKVGIAPPGLFRANLSFLRSGDTRGRGGIFQGRFEQTELRPAVLPVTLAELFMGPRLRPTTNPVRDGWRANLKLTILK